MKKSILVFCTVLIIFSLTAFSYMSWGNGSSEGGEKPEASNNQVTAVNDYFLNPFGNQGDLDFVYNVDSRFIHTVTKEQLHNATSIEDLLPEEATNPVEVYDEVKLAILKGEDEIHEKGKSEVLNAAQLALIKSTDYSSNFYITAVYKRKNLLTGELQGDYLTYYITIVPEREASFVAGHDALISYLKENSIEKTALLERKNLQSGMVSFVITPSGTVSKVNLISTSGYEELDQTMVDLITNMPGKWYPATNEKGEGVEQELFFSFGIDGC